MERYNFTLQQHYRSVSPPDEDPGVDDPNVLGGGGGAPAPIAYGLNVTYFDESNFTGHSVSKVDPYINYNWGFNAPYPQLGRDTFSAIWSGNVNVTQAGKYTFYARTDDGVRLYIDGRLIINAWRNKGLSEVRGTIQLSPGRHQIIMQYYENKGRASAALSWSATGTIDRVIKFGRRQFTFKRTVTILRKQVIPPYLFAH